MRISFRTVLSVLLLWLSYSLYAHINTGILPQGLQSTQPYNNLFEIELSKPNLLQQKSKGLLPDKNGTALRFAEIIPTEITTGNAGVWSVNENGAQMWQVALTSADALGCIIYFSKLELPIGSQLYVYNPDGTVVFGPYTHNDNPSGDDYAIGPVYGETAIVEYVAPMVKSLSGIIENRIPTIVIDGYGYVYRDMMDLRKTNSPSTRNFGGSQSCEVNINCSEGNDWRDQQKGVARIIWTNGRGTYYCTGSLVNNTAYDGTPYFLTADHCGGDVDQANFNKWLFYFNFESEECVNIRPQNTRVITGCTRKARSPLRGGSDYVLLELNTTAERIAEIGGVYNGWDKSGASSTKGVSIHHPNGDIKKISTYTQSLISGTYKEGNGVTGANAAHWLVYWAETANGHGVTEGGSSGSPIFNTEGLIVGTLTGGTSFCSSYDDSDFYGKMSYHWNSVGSLAESNLNLWLNPTNSREEQCPLYDPTGFFQVTPSAFLFETIATSNTSIIQAGSSSEDWVATANVDWLTIEPATGRGSNRSTTITLTSKINFEDTDRIGVVTVKHADETIEIQVTQKGYGSIVYGFESDFELYADFEVDNFGLFTTVDLDRSKSYTSQGMEFPNANYIGAYIPFNPATTNPPQTGEEWAAHSGTKYAACFAAVMPKDGGSGPNNDWLITPMIYLRKNSHLSFWAKSVTDEYGLDRFNVYVSTTNNSINSFEKISEGNYTQTTTAWKEYAYDLSAYDGKTVYVAIQCVSEDAFAFLVDDVKIVTDTADIARNVTKNRFILYPNPTQEMLVIERQEEETQTLKLLNVMGGVIRQEKISGKRKVLNVSDLPFGVYFIQIGTKVHKFLKQ